MRCKNKVLTHFQTLVVKIQSIFHQTIQFLQSDNGTENINNAFSHYCKALGIKQRFSCPTHRNKMVLPNVSTVILLQ